MKIVPKISDTEWEIMKVVWRQTEPISAGNIIKELQKDDDWHPKTAKTLLNRLVKKRALTFEKEGRAYLYKPLAKELDCVKMESASFLRRIFDGRLALMLGHFVSQKRLSPKDVQELKKILDKK